MRTHRTAIRDGRSWLRAFPALLLAAVPLLSVSASGREMPVPDERIPPGEPALDPFLLERTHFDVRVTGPVARVTVTQHWNNPNDRAIDGLYIFPLPHDAAVSDLRIEIGERVIRSDIKRRAEAREIYERARQEGRLAGLLDQERPNVFAQRIANLMPGAAIRVVITYEHAVAIERGRGELVVPTVVGPRFVPAHQGDPGEILPPIDLRHQRDRRQTLSLEALIDTGVPLASIGSPSHPLAIEREGSSRARLTLAPSLGEALDRDVRIAFTAAGSHAQVGALSWRDTERSKHGAFTLMLAPPLDPDASEITPRELYFVLDCSGSMHGEPLRAARDVVRHTLARMHPRDTFTIQRFSERASSLSSEPLANTPENIRRAIDYLDGLRGEGGTHMIEGVRAALAGQRDEGRLRVVAFLTDGYIGNEREILAEVKKLLGSARIFSFGVGSSVNRYLLESLAEEGRGDALFQSPRESPMAIVDDFVRRIDGPVLTDVRLSFEDLDVQDIEPGVLPDLFAGQPLVVHGRYAKPGTGVVIVEGRQAGRLVTKRQVVTLLDEAPENEALARLWARARIHRLEREQHQGKRTDVTERVIALALEHRLATEHTSFVAVDSEISNLGGNRTQLSVPVELPEGVEESAIGGNYVLRSAAPPASLGKTMGREYSRHLMIPRDEIADAEPGARQQEARKVEQPVANEGWLGASFSIELDVSRSERIVVEDDGELWVERDGRRTLVRALSAAEQDTLRALIAALGPGDADPGRHGGLTIRSGVAARGYSLAGSSGALQRLVQTLREWSR